MHDSTAGFKAFRADALHAIDVLGSTSNGCCFQIENTWKAHLAGLRTNEVRSAFVDRTQGSCTMSGAIALEALLRVLAWRWAELTDPRAGVRGTQEPPAPRNDHRREIGTFLAAGGAGYLVDVLTLTHSSTPDPSPDTTPSRHVRSLSWSPPR
ncbi:hypothetical protein [Nocardioides sp.]|uniref:hypothetical protein n=1 Tax=Nocardioides sp. TaxID=35761 RepID=UPI00286D34E4|nr:hypothetical protein [Nocardioides sp.]